MHLSRSRYAGMENQGLFRMPVTLHVTFCGLRDITGHEIDVEKYVDCDECLIALTWEHIDAMKAAEEAAVA